MSERLLEIVRAPDGRFLASFDDGEPAVEVTSWDDIRRLRGRRHIVDHWSGDDRKAFIERYGHPFDDWWNQLTAACAEALAADPNGPVPQQHHDEVKRSLRHQSTQAGLGLEGSRLTAEVRAYVAKKAQPKP
jgi:hypothetical protein